MHYEAHRYSKSIWCPKLVRETDCNIVFEEHKYRSKERCQEWCDKMNEASKDCTPKFA